jgi:5-methylcytosine-specific restriction endonuclease McrA
MVHIHNSAMILTLDAHWEPHRWITLNNAMEYEAKDLVQNRLGQKLFVYHGGFRMDGERSRLETSSIIVLKGAPKATRHKVPTLTNKALFRRDLGICAYCGGEFQEADLTRDHIHPSSQGGKDVWTNVVTACYGCNNAKGDKTLKQAGMELLYVPYIPCKAEMLILMNRKVLDDQMELLLARIRNKDSRVLQRAA